MSFFSFTPIYGSLSRIKFMCKDYYDYDHHEYDESESSKNDEHIEINAKNVSATVEELLCAATRTGVSR